MKRSWIVLGAFLLLMSLAAGAVAAPFTLRILHVNDFHGFAEPMKPMGSERPLGGIASLAGAVDRARQQQPVLLLAGGDMIRGNAWANLFQGKSVIDVMNAMKFDAMVVGNHEFDFGPAVLRDRIAQADFPIIGANVEGCPSLKPFVIKNIQGVKIALIGVVTEDAAATDPRQVAGLKFTSPESALRKYLPALKRQADIIVVLSHCGYPVDRELAARVPGLDVIVGGHSHTKMLHPEVVGRTIIVQAWEHAKALGILDLQIKSGKIVKFQGALEEISPAVGAPDLRVQEIVARYEGLANPPLRQIIGETRVNLDVKDIRTEETNLGDFIADVMRQTAGADAAIIHSGCIRAGIPRGKIETQDLYNALPYDNYLIAVRLTGAQLKEALEHGVSQQAKPSNRFPQVAGLSFSYSRSAPAGSRVKDVTVGGRPLESHKEYVVATTDYLAAGGEGYRVFSEALKSTGDSGNQPGAPRTDNLVYNNPGTWLRDLVIGALQAQKIIGPQVENRINAVD